MAIEITSNNISFDGQEFNKGDVTASKDIETKRKSSDGIPIKKIRSFASASTFIDLDETNRSAGDRIKVKVATTFEALDISTKKISVGPKETVPLELTGTLDIRPANNKPHKFHGIYQISGKHAAGNNLPIADNSVVSLSVTGSNVYSGSYYVANFASMSMDISQGGFFGLAVSGSTHASNIANMADFLINFNQSGSTNFEGGDTTVSQSADNNFEVSGGNTNFNTNINVDVTDATASFDISGSGDTVTFEVSGGNTNFNTNINVDVTDATSSFGISGSGDTTTFEVSGGNTNFNTNVNVDVTDPTSSFDVSGSGDTTTFEVSGGNTNFNTNVNVDVTDPTSSFDISGSDGSVTFEVSGGNTNFETDVNVDVTSPSSSFDISGSDGSVTFEVSGGNTNINSEFTQSGEAVFEGGTTTFNNSGSFNDTGSFTGSMDDIATEVSGNLGVVGSIDQVFTNNVPITSSLTLTNATHGMGRQLLVRSGSTPVYSSGVSEGLPTLHYPHGGRYIANPAGDIVLTLPAADIGLSFHIINKGGFSSFNLPGYGFQGPPSVKISPSGSNKFIYGAGGSAGVAGKAIINHSSSYSNGDYAVVSCVSQSHWMIQQIGGTWVDEA